MSQTLAVPDVIRPQYTLWAYLWDLLEDGLDAAAAYCREELGLDGLSVATAYHSFQQFRPRSRTRRLLVSAEAAVYFQPDTAIWRDVLLRPRLGDLAQAGNPLADLAGISARRGLALTSWTVCLHNSYLAARYPEWAQQSAFGDRSGWILCPGADEVRAYVLALCTDLATNYGIRRLELESCDFGGYGHAHHHLKEGVDLGPVGRYLLGLCFCPACMRHALTRGVDIVGLRRWVSEQLQPVFDRGTPLAGSVEEVLHAYADLAAFQRQREDLVTSLVQEVNDATDVEVSVILMGDRWQSGAIPQRMADAADLVEILAYSRDAHRVGGQIQEMVAAQVHPAQIVLGLQCYPPCAGAAEDVAANVQAGLDLGVGRFSFYNYGIAPPACLEYLRR